MGDKDVRGLLEVFEEMMQQVVVTQVASTPRGMPADELGELAAEIFGAERVTVAPRLDDAIETAVNLAEADDVGAPGVLVTGSVVLVGEARTLLVKEQAAEPRTRRSRRRLGRRLLRRTARSRIASLVMTTRTTGPSGSGRVDELCRRAAT